MFDHCDQFTRTRGARGDRQREQIATAVEMSLPAKYRRAYRYLIDHLESAELTVREIAEHVNVTERALQSAFRQHLGMTPAEVLRRCRVERIRGEDGNRYSGWGGASAGRLKRS